VLPSYHLADFGWTALAGTWEPIGVLILASNAIALGAVVNRRGRIEGAQVGE
jgi:hypothetical protein